MVGTGAETLEQAHPAARAAFGDAHRADEILAVEMRRTTEGHKKAAGAERADCERIEFDVEVLGAPRIGGGIAARNGASRAR